MSNESKELEPVHTVRWFWDRARTGIAERSGQLVFFECMWDEVGDDYAGVYLLFEADQDTLRAEVEMQQIFDRLLAARRSGAIDDRQFDRLRVALPDEQLRYQELDQKVRARLPGPDAVPIAAVTARFVRDAPPPREPYSPMPAMRVEWTSQVSLQDALGRFKRWWN